MQQRRLQAVGGARQGPLQSLAPSPRQPWAWAWAWALVMVVVMGLAPAEASGDGYDLEAMIKSHSEALKKVERYMRYTQVFWNWYHQKHRRLDQLLEQDLQPTPLLPGAASDSLLQELSEEVAVLAADLAAMNSTTQENQEIREQLNEYRNKLSTLEEQLENERQKSAEDRRQLTEEVASLATTLDQVRANSSQLQKDISLVRAETGGVAVGDTDLDDLFNRVERLESTSNITEENINDLYRTISNLQASLRET